MNMRPALLLVDVQRDFLARPLMPPAGAVVENIKRLLEACRKAGVPVFHSRTLVRPDGANRMPHWKREERWACVAGTAGAESPGAAAPAPGEAVFTKTYYSAFGDPGLAPALAGKGVTHLIVAGLYTHACVQATVMDAYAAGFEVWVAEEAVASYDPLHAALARNFLGTRACRFASFDELEELLGLRRSAPDISAEVLPSARAGGKWLPADGLAAWPRYLPGNLDALPLGVPLSGRSQVDVAVTAALAAGATWASLPAAERAARIHAWADRIQAHKEAFVALLAREVGKPRRECTAEIDWAVQLAQAAARRAAGESEETLADGVRVRSRPLGVAGLITPWNNPVAIPAGKLAPALAYGNTVVWKPALPAPETSLLLLQTLDEAGIPEGCVSLVFGDAQSGRELAGHRGVAALSFTGSTANGRMLAALCAVTGKPLQAELGGNNAMLIMDCRDPQGLAGELARTLFSFAGQRCTAPRRLIVGPAVPAAFKASLVEAINSLRLGDAQHAETDVGPLVSREAQARIHALVQDALGRGARLLCGGGIPAGMAHGCWYRPTLLENLDRNAPAVCEEAFGPVAVWQDAADFDEAMGLCNSVRQGLVATLVSDDTTLQQRFLARAEAGMLRINQLAKLHPDAPFAGWKDSAIGPPEHGAGDRLFYTRMQTLYGGA